MMAPSKNFASCFAAKMMLLLTSLLSDLIALPCPWPDLVGGCAPPERNLHPPEKVAPPCNYLHPPGKV